MKSAVAGIMILLGLGLPSLICGEEIWMHQSYLLEKVPDFLGPSEPENGSESTEDPQKLQDTFSDPFDAELFKKIFTDELQEKIYLNYPLEFPEGAWIHGRGTREKPILVMLNTAQNHEWLQYALMRNGWLAVLANVEVEIRAFPADHIEKLESEEAKTLSHKGLLALRKDPSGQVVFTGSVRKKPGTLAVLEHQEGSMRQLMPQAQTRYRFLLRAYFGRDGMILFHISAYSLEKAGSSPGGLIPDIYRDFDSHFVLPPGRQVPVSVILNSETDELLVLYAKVTLEQPDGKVVVIPSQPDSDLHTRMISLGTDDGLLSRMFYANALEDPRKYVSLEMHETRHPLPANEILQFLRADENLRLPEDLTVRHLPRLHLLMLQSGGNLHDSIPGDYFLPDYRKEPPLIGLRVLAVAEERIDAMERALERTSGRALSLSEIVELWRSGKAKTVFLQRARGQNGISFFHESGRIFERDPGEDEKNTDSERKIGQQFKFTPTHSFHEKDLTYLQFQWKHVETQKNEPGMATSTFRETNFYANIVLQGETRVLAGQRRSADGRQRLFFILEQSR